MRWGVFPQGCPPHLRLALVAGEAAHFLPSLRGGALAAPRMLQLGLQGPPVWVL